jgi:hypothetical protein
MCGYSREDKNEAENTFVKGQGGKSRKSIGQAETRPNMIRGWKRAVPAVLVLILLAPLLFGCGGVGGGGGKVTITIGYITDFTGPAAGMVQTLNYVVEDVVRHFNEEDLIPGVKIRLVTYDGRSDPARDIPGYDWCRERGARVVITLVGATGEILKPFAEKDKVVLAALGGSMPLIEPPGWAFWFSIPSGYEMETLLKWISEEHWDYAKGIPKVGMAAWNEPTTRDILTGLKKYSQDHPDKFEWVGSFLVPLGTMSWGGEIEKLKNCDYVQGAIVPAPLATFVKNFQGRGYHATFISGSATPSFKGFLVDTFGWEPLDGWLSTSIGKWWTEHSGMVGLANELLYKYRVGQAEDIVYQGMGYVGGFHNVYAILEVFKKAIEEVGAENFNGQAFYDAALNYRTTWEGYPQWGFSETKRYLIGDVQVFEWNAEAKDLVRLSDWLPAVVE